jgi:hypothetical protein
LVEQIRRATHRDFALGTGQFGAGVASALDGTRTICVSLRDIIVSE